MAFFSTEAFRLSTVNQLVDRGWDVHWAGLASVVMHPLDDQPVPSRPFEKMIRKASRHAAKQLRGRSQADAENSIRACLLTYVQIAQEHRERFYVERYTTFVRQLEQLPSIRRGKPPAAIVPNG